MPTIFPPLRDQINHDEKSSLVYKVPCQNCAFVYIGQTTRDLKSRLTEHQRTIKFQRPKKSALCQHSMKNDHPINWSDVKILKLEHDYSKRLYAESWNIKKSLKCSTEMMGVHSLLFIESCLIPTVENFVRFNHF